MICDCVSYENGAAAEPLEGLTSSRDAVKCSVAYAGARVAGYSRAQQLLIPQTDSASSGALDQLQWALRDSNWRTM